MMTESFNGITYIMTPEEEAERLAEEEANKLPDKIEEITHEANRRVNIVINKEDIDRMSAEALYLVDRKIDGLITADEITRLSEYRDKQQQAAFIRAREADLKVQAQEAADPSILEVRSDLAWS